LLNDKVAEGKFAQRIEHGMARLIAGYDRLLGRTLAARSAVLAMGVTMLVGIVILFSGAQRELAPQEDQGFVLVQTKGPQYANIDYTARFAQDVERMFRQFPEYVSTFITMGMDGMNSSFSGIILKEWSERPRGADAIQAELNAKGSAITGVFATAFQPPPLPAGSGGLPVQMVIRSSEDFPAVFTCMEKLKGAAWSSGLFAFVDSDLAFDS